MNLLPQIPRRGVLKLIAATPLLSWLGTVSPVFGVDIPIEGSVKFCKQLSGSKRLSEYIRCVGCTNSQVWKNHKPHTLSIDNFSYLTRCLDNSTLVVDLTIEVRKLSNPCVFKVYEASIDRGVITYAKSPLELCSYAAVDYNKIDFGELVKP